MSFIFVDEEESPITTLTPAQTDLAYSVEHVIKYIRDPRLQLRGLPMGEVIGQEARVRITRAWKAGLDEARWNIMLMGTSDVWDAFDIFNDLCCRIHAATWIQ